MISKNQIKFIKSLQYKKNRLTHRSFVVESHKNVVELLNSSYEVVQIFATKEWIKENKIETSILINEISQSDLQRISRLSTASDVLAVVRIPNLIEEFIFKGVNIALDNIQDPGNLGAIIRTCDWFGIKTIFCSHNTVDIYNPKVVQSTMGSIFRVNVIYTDLQILIQDVPSMVDLYAAVLNGEDVDSFNISGDSLIFFGNESNGISEEIKGSIKNKIMIKRIGKTDSLNVSVSCGIILNKFC